MSAQSRSRLREADVGLATVNAAYGRTQYYLNLTALLALLPALLSMLRMQNVVLTDEKGADAVVVLGQADDIEHESESRAVH